MLKEEHDNLGLVKKDNDEGEIVESQDIPE